MESGTQPAFEQPVPPIEEKKPADEICLFGALPLVENSNAVQNEFNGVLLGKDIEAIHRIRVASRRLRTAIRLFQDCLPAKKINSWNSQVRALTGALGKARDIDVQYELLSGIYKKAPDPKFKPGIRRILLRIRQSRGKAQDEVIPSVERLKKSKILDQIIKKFNPMLESTKETPHSIPLFQLSCDWINHRLNELLEYEVYIRRPEYKDELHAMRIAAKRLRYTMEIFSSLYPDKLEKPLQAARKSQQILGEVHDCDVWIEFLPSFYESEKKRMQKFYGHTRPLHYLKPGLDYFQANRQAERDRLYKEFLENWRQWHQEELWIKLREMILVSISKEPLAITSPNPSPAQ